jgi:biotin carboxyl carrier protein
VTLPKADELSSLLRQTDIASLELTGPDGFFVSVLNDTLAPSGRTLHGLSPVKAPSPGRLLLAHPLHPLPLCTRGQRIRAGQTVAFVRVGDLLLPAQAPVAGTFVRYCHVPDTIVGWGCAVAEVIPMA